MIGAAFKVGLAAFGGAGLVTKLIIVLGLVSTLLAAYGVWHYHVWSNGYEDAIAAIARGDAKAVANAQAKRSVWRDCRDSGLRWDQTTGKCEVR
jgi:hypothetical protein